MPNHSNDQAQPFNEVLRVHGGGFSVNPPSDTGLRFDGGKNRMELIPPEWLESLGEVLTVGAQKYDDRNWEKGMAWSKMIGCAFRHITRFLRGERFDRETGCHHLAHAAWNLLALLSYDARKIGDDDLPRAAALPTKRDQ